MFVVMIVCKAVSLFAPLYSSRAIKPSVFGTSCFVALSCNARGAIFATSLASEFVDSALLDYHVARRGERCRFAPQISDVMPWHSDVSALCRSDAMCSPRAPQGTSRQLAANITRERTSRSRREHIVEKSTCFRKCFFLAAALGYSFALWQMKIRTLFA